MEVPNELTLGTDRMIRVGVKVLQAAFPQSKWVRPLEQTISWLAWLMMVLWVSGLLPVILNELDQITWKVGSSTLSVRAILEGLLTGGAVLILTLWISAAIESRLLRSAKGGELSLRKAVSSVVRALLMFIGLILALSSAGIDLTALSVLGGAVGVGIGFGLQKLAANYISGFVILTERSVRIGDTVKVDGFEGRITDIKARYTVIRAPNGRESIVPNEMLITSRVENSSLADPKVLLTTSVQVAYGSDLAALMPQLAAAVAAVPRVLADPAPSVQLSAFAPDGLDLTILRPSVIFGAEDRFTNLFARLQKLFPVLPLAGAASSTAWPSCTSAVAPTPALSIWASSSSTPARPAPCTSPASPPVPFTTAAGMP